MSSLQAGRALECFLVENGKKLAGVPIDEATKSVLASALVKACHNEQDDNSWIDEFAKVLKPDNAEWLSEQLTTIIHSLMEDVSNTSSPACPPTPEKATIAAPVTPSPPRSASPDVGDQTATAGEQGNGSDVVDLEHPIRPVDSSGSAEAVVDVEASPAPVTSTSAFKLRPEAKVFTPLRVDAKEFVPSWASTPPQPAPNQPHSAASKGSASWYWEDSSPAAEAWGDQDVNGGWTAGNVSVSDAMAMLASWFPSYSMSALRAIYELNHADLEATIQELCNLQWQELDTSALARPPKQQQQHSPAIADQAEFPALSAANGNGQQKSAKPQSLSFAAIVKQSQTAEEPQEQKSGSTKANGTSNKKASHSAAPQQAPTATEKAEVPWLATGEAVTAEYSTAREKARDLARIRNVCFQQATQAYLAGNKALAKQLSEKGRQHNELMKQAHVSASQTIFANRNAQLEHLQLPGQAGLVDLHGLHVAEAKRVLERLISQKNGKSRLLVCVGTGHHTKGSRTPARLSQAVEDYLRQQQLRHRFLQAGLLEVSF